jgi:hypothetical protein
MTEPGPDECSADERAPDFDVVDEPDAGALSTALEEVGDIGS